MVLGTHLNEQENQGLLPFQTIPLPYDRLEIKSESAVKFNQSGGYLYPLVVLQKMTCLG